MSQQISSKIFIDHSSWLFNKIIQGFDSPPIAHTGTLVLCPLTSRMLLLSDQLMYQRVPAVVPTIPISIALSNAALTDVPSSIISCSNTTLVPLKGRHREPQTMKPFIIDAALREPHYHSACLLRDRSVLSSSFLTRGREKKISSPTQETISA